MVQGEWCYLGCEGEIEWLIGLVLGDHSRSFDCRTFGKNEKHGWRAHES